MHIWKGKITAGEYSMTAIVYYQKPDKTMVGDWYGLGMAEIIWPEGEHETDIGSIIITSSLSDGSIEFDGNGEPKTSFVREMGIEE